MPSEHLLHLFDTIESRATGVAAFVGAGLAAGDDVVLFATSDHWKAIDERLQLSGGHVASAIARGRLTVLDAHETLDDLTKRGAIDPALFSTRVALAIPENPPSQNRGVRVYGELVDLLAEEGNLTGAVALERLWNDHLSSRSFTLMCGYSSTHFGHPLTRSALHEICACHSRIDTADDDPLGSFLIAHSRRSRQTPLDSIRG